MKKSLIHAGWEELNEYVKQLQVNSSRQIWHLQKNHPLDQIAIAELVNRNWKVKLSEHCKSSGGICYNDGIVLYSGLIGYRRDVTLFHELAHAYYGIHGEDLPDGPIMDDYLKFNNNAIAEWIGRKARADHYTLRAAVISFGLEPQIYDKSSYLAFAEPVDQQQCKFPFASDYNHLEEIFMDAPK